jgi:hypothetical protein
MFLVYRRLFGAPVQSAANETAAEATPAPADDGAPVAAATAFDNSRPSIVSQVAAAAETKVESGAAASPAKRADAAAEMAAAAPASTVPKAAAEEPQVPSAPAMAGAGSHDSSPELVLEDASDQSEPEMSDDRLKNLNVEEIDLGFEEQARNTG